MATGRGRILSPDVHTGDRPATIPRMFVTVHYGVSSGSVNHAFGCKGMGKQGCFRCKGSTLTGVDQLAPDAREIAGACRLLSGECSSCPYSQSQKRTMKGRGLFPTYESARHK